MGIVLISFIIFMVFTFLSVLSTCVGQRMLDHSHNPYEWTSNIFDVQALGAIGDGVADDTQAFVTAWGFACQSHSQSSTLLVPQGYTFMVKSIIFAGPCQFGLTFQIEGVIVAPDGPESWPKNTSLRKWLVFFRANGLILRGGGVIDGRGEKWWNLPCKPHRGINGTKLAGPCDSPTSLRFLSTSSVTVHGINLQNSPQFHIRFDNCRNVIVNNITINSPAVSPNTDGVHVRNTVSVGIYNSLISNGDDCVSIGSGSMNLFIQNLTCGHGHGISIGSLGKKNSHACVTNVTVKDTFIRQSHNGVRIKTWQGGTGYVSSVTFKNLYMDIVRSPIIIDQYYCDCFIKCANQSQAVSISNITYSNIKGTYNTKSPPIHLACSESVPCTNITLDDVLLFPSNKEVTTLTSPFCWNAYGGLSESVIPQVTCLQHVFPPLAKSIQPIQDRICCHDDIYSMMNDDIY